MKTKQLIKWVIFIAVLVVIYVINKNHTDHQLLEQKRISDSTIQSKDLFIIRVADEALTYRMKTDSVIKERESWKARYEKAEREKNKIYFKYVQVVTHIDSVQLRRTKRLQSELDKY